MTKLAMRRGKVVKGLEGALLDSGLGGENKGIEAVKAAWEAVGWYEDE